MEREKLPEDILRVLLTEEQLREKVSELGARITEDYRGKRPLFLGVLKGCFVFMADLMRAVHLPCAIDFMAVSSYGSGASTTGAVRITKDLSRDIEREDVIIVEDILDSGVRPRSENSFLSGRVQFRPARRTASPGAREATVILPHIFSLWK